MASIATKAPVRSVLSEEKVAGVWTGGGAAADCTHTSTDHSQGITSVAYNAATGKYLITLSQWGQQLLPGSSITVHRAAGAAPLVVNLIRTITVASDNQSATIAFEVWDMATPSLIALATTDKVLISLVFARTKPVT